MAWIPPLNILKRLIGRAEPDKVWYCTSCGARNPINVTICVKCGKKRQLKA